jgi:TPR repeat protein
MKTMSAILGMQAVSHLKFLAATIRLLTTLMIMLLVSGLAVYFAPCDAEVVSLETTLKAAEQGDAVSQNTLGLIYAKGLGIPQDYAKSFYWHTKAAEQGNIDSIHWLRSRYAMGDIENFPKDNNQAFYWSKKGAEQGDADSQNALGVMYSEGLGVPQDYKHAFFWYTKAAEQGHAIAQYNLGSTYAKGEGVPQDYKHAYAWFSLASMSGNSFFVKYRDQVAEKLTPAGIESAQALAVQLQEEIDDKEP